MVRSLLLERAQTKHLAEDQERRVAKLEQRVDDIYQENLGLQVELDRLRKRYCGPRSDRHTDGLHPKLTSRTSSTGHQMVLPDAKVEVQT
jgi:regulator of replication initiation timing